MSYVGEPHKYDVFFSYAHAVEALRGQLDMREYSRTVIQKVINIVLMSLLEVPGGEDLGWYLDRDEIVTALPLTEALEETVKKSAVLVVLMSPQYHKSWSLKELNWFLEKAHMDGGGFRQVVLLELQRTPDSSWPDVLRDGAGERLLSQRLYDENGLPVGFEEFDQTGKLSFSGGLLTRTAIEIKNKLLEVRRLLEAQRVMAASKVNPWALLGQDPPDDLLIYLDAEPQDESVWQARREALAAAHAVVLPDAPIDTEMTARSESVLSVYKDCDALVLHRVRKDDLTPSRLRRAYHDRKLLFQKEQKNVRWALLDELPEPFASAATFRIPRVSTAEENWPERLFQVLGGAPAPGTEK